MKNIFGAVDIDERWGMGRLRMKSSSRSRDMLPVLAYGREPWTLNKQVKKNVLGHI